MSRMNTENTTQRKVLFFFYFSKKTFSCNPTNIFFMSSPINLSMKFIGCIDNNHYLYQSEVTGLSYCYLLVVWLI